MFATRSPESLLSTQGTQRSTVSTHISALLAYFVLALIVTYPTILHFTTQIPGELIPDRNQDYWNLWWITQAVKEHTNPLYTYMLFYPYGVPLYYHILGITEWFIGLGPLLGWGYAAAYNTVVIMAFTLSGYGAFRLALYITGRPVASFLGGTVFGFTPYMLAAVSNWQYENTSIQWIPFYAEAWLRAWRGPMSEASEWQAGRLPLIVTASRFLRASIVPLMLAGIVFALGMYTSLYYPVQLLIFTAVLLIYILLKRRQWWQDLAREAVSLVVVAVVALVLTLPLVVGLVQNYNNPRLEVEARGQMLEHSADLLSFVAFPHDHPLLGGTRYGTATLDVRDNLTLGYVALALSILGAVVSWRKKGKHTPFWVALGLTAMVLAMGPELRINGTETGIPMPFALLEGLPGLEAAGKLYRLVPITRCAMAVLATWGAAWIFDSAYRLPGFGQRWAQGKRRGILFAVVLSLVLFELPLHPRYLEPFNISPGWAQLALMPQGGLMELPFATQNSAIIADRMINQTVHDHPIMSGYISRNYRSPITDSCSPFWGFISPLDVPREGAEIASPLVVDRPADVLNFFNIRYLALYSRDGFHGSPIPGDQGSAFRRIIPQVGAGAPFYSDDYVSLYTVPEHSTANSPASFHIGDGWYSAEQGGGEPLRWMKNGRASVCVFAPRPITASLTLEGTSLATPRQVSMNIGSNLVYTGTLPADGAFESIKTAPVNWQPGVTQVEIAVQEPGTAPSSVDPNSKDNRPLTAGFRAVRLEPEGQK